MEVGAQKLTPKFDKLKTTLIVVVTKNGGAVIDVDQFLEDYYLSQVNNIMLVFNNNVHDINCCS